MTFHVGQKVVCIVDPSDWYGEGTKELPQQGFIYTVRTVEVAWDGDTYIRLAEIVNEPIFTEFEGLAEAEWWVCGFRPLVENKTDISVFTDLLNQKQREHSLCGND